MSKKDLVIISNEKISKKEKSFFCDNIDLKSIPEDLSKICPAPANITPGKVQRL